MHILITGGTGAIGQRLTVHLLNHGYRVTILSRQTQKPKTLPTQVKFQQWDGKTTTGWADLLNQVDAVINLAGAGVADKRWSTKRKDIIHQSRVNAGQAIAAGFEKAQNKPMLLIQSSAVGYYGNHETATITEADAPGQGFLADVCVAWENSVESVTHIEGVRVVYIRTGIVLDPKAGAFVKMALPFKIGLGGPMGSGEQWIPWIHYYDEIEAIRFLLEHPTLEGPVNLTAPHPVRNREFAKLLGQALHRPAIMPAPAFALKLALGEMASAVLGGQRVLPAKLQSAGFQFRYAQTEVALKDLVKAS